jgi:hypothetical protein
MSDRDAPSRSIFLRRAHRGGEAHAVLSKPMRNVTHVSAAHTFAFGLSSGHVIDGSHGGKSARYLNHACLLSREAIEVCYVSQLSALR